MYFQVLSLASCCQIMAQSLVHIATYFTSLWKKSDYNGLFLCTVNDNDCKSDYKPVHAVHMSG